MRVFDTTKTEYSKDLPKRSSRPSFSGPRQPRWSRYYDNCDCSTPAEGSLIEQGRHNVLFQKHQYKAQCTMNEPELEPLVEPSLRTHDSVASAKGIRTQQLINSPSGLLPSSAPLDLDSAASGTPKPKPPDLATLHLGPLPGVRLLSRTRSTLHRNVSSLKSVQQLLQDAIPEPSQDSIDSSVPYSRMSSQSDVDPSPNASTLNSTRSESKTVKFSEAESHIPGTQDEDDEQPNTAPVPESSMADEQPSTVDAVPEDTDVMTKRKRVCFYHSEIIGISLAVG